MKAEDFNNRVAYFDDVLPDQVFQKITYEYFQTPMTFAGDISGSAGYTTKPTNWGVGATLFGCKGNGKDMSHSAGRFFELLPYVIAGKIGLDMNYLEVMRIASFMQFPNLPRTNDCSGLHTDNDLPHLVMLLYLYDVDGDTVFFDNNTGEESCRVQSKANRVAVFDGLITHSSSAPTQNVRPVININLVDHRFIHPSKDQTIDFYHMEKRAEQEWLAFHEQSTSDTNVT